MRTKIERFGTNIVSILYMTFIMPFRDMIRLKKENESLNREIDFLDAERISMYLRK